MRDSIVSLSLSLFVCLHGWFSFFLWYCCPYIYLIVHLFFVFFDLSCTTHIDTHTHAHTYTTTHQPTTNDDMIYIKTQAFRLLRYYSPAPRNIARSDWATQNITHNMTSSIKQPYGAHSTNYASFMRKGILIMPYISLTTKKNSKESLTTIFCTVTTHLYISFNRKLWMS